MKDPDPFILMTGDGTPLVTAAYVGDGAGSPHAVALHANAYLSPERARALAAVLNAHADAAEAAS